MVIYEEYGYLVCKLLFDSGFAHLGIDKIKSFQSFFYCGTSLIQWFSEVTIFVTQEKKIETN